MSEQTYESRVPATVGVEESYPVTKKQLELISNSNVIVKIDNPWPGLEKNSYAGQKGLWWSGAEAILSSSNKKWEVKIIVRASPVAS